MAVPVGRAGEHTQARCWCCCCCFMHILRVLLFSVPAFFLSLVFCPLCFLFVVFLLYFPPFSCFLLLVLLLIILELRDWVSGVFFWCFFGALDWALVRWWLGARGRGAFLCVCFYLLPCSFSGAVFA